MPLGTLLVVEDDSAIRRGLVDALRYGGYTVQEAADGREGRLDVGHVFQELRADDALPGDDG